MAGTSPRRSVRSRTSQPLNSNSHHSSTSSSSSGRGDRTTRTSAKAESPRKLTSNESLSSEPLDDRVAFSVEESLSTRRRKRGQGEEQDNDSKEKASEMPNGVNEPAGEDDEAVRCICGSEEYPGPPQISEEDSKKGIKEATELDLITPEDYTEDLAGFFLQCDMCKVWQHGGCVGIKNEDMSPDEYFCELCRSDLHKIYTASNEQKYSHYLPLYRHLSRSTSRAASFSKDGTRSPRAGSKNGRPSSSSMLSANAKRRSTMNSRDAAYDEEEQLRRAIEASKGEKTESSDGGTRRTKRGRSDSEEKSGSMKRQRTLSTSPSPQKEPAHFGEGNESDDAVNTRNGGAKKIRGAAARNHREKEMREEREKARLEAANKRKGRAERRRVDDSDPGEDTPAHAPTTHSPPDKPAASTTTQPAIDPPAPAEPSLPDSPRPPKPTPLSTTSHKKGGRPPHARRGKVGKNQYTRDEDSPARSQSRDGGVASRDEGSGHSGGGHREVGREGRVGRPRGGGGKISMLDMRRRVSGMLEFIGRTQVDMAEAGDAGGEAERMVRGLVGGLMPMLRGEAVGRSGEEEKGEGEFKELNLLEMMDALTGELVKWQKQFT